MKRKPKRSNDSILERLARIEVVTWEWNERAREAGAKPGTRAIGVVSQQLANVFPELAVERDDGLVAVDYGGLAAVVLAGVQELSRRVEALERAAEAAPRNARRTAIKPSRAARRSPIKSASRAGRPRASSRQRRRADRAADRRVRAT